MNDDPAPLSEVKEVHLDSTGKAAKDTKVRDVTTAPSDQSSRIAVEDTRDFKAADKADPDGDSRSDSEAETVVPSGKDESSVRSDRRAFRHEDETETVPEADRNALFDGVIETQRNRDADGSSKKEIVTQEPSANVLVETNNSSNLSSTISSPAREPRSPYKNRSDSIQSRSSARDENTSPPPEARSRKRKRQLPSNETEGIHRRSPSKQNSATESKDNQELRGSRKVSRQEISVDRSTSPIARPQPRSQSAQSPDLQSLHRRKKPPPLLVNHQRKTSEEPYAESDDESGSVHTAVHLRKLVSADTAAISPAKTPHKKLRDKNGRTLLARACAGDEVDPVKLRLQERPQDLNIADNAGNSPLQIASLEGNANIVDVLLKAGCDITCKNIDSDTPLIDAVENGHLEVVKLLLEAGLDPRQSNAKGEEPLDLLDPNDDNYEDIKSALIEAKGNDSRRMHSEDQYGQAGATRDGISVQSPHGSPPPPSARSPPSHAPLPRRRTARSEATRNDLLWVNPTPENLRDRAGKGDVEGVVYILDMCPSADIEAVIAAARGGHKMVLELLLAMGKPDPDPDPLHSSGYKVGYNTPMLAAIGRGNIGVINLLLSEPGFNPTRRLHRNLTYYEVAKERQGLNWEEEYNILKSTFDNYGSQSTTSGSVDQARAGTTGREVKRSRRSTLTSTVHEPVNHDSLESAASEGRTQKGRLLEGKGEVVDQDQAQTERIQYSSYKHLQVPIADSRDASVAVSDSENTTLRSPTDVKTKRSSSDVEADAQPEKQLHKPRRKLVSGKVFRNDKEKKRRASLMSEASSSSSQNQDSTKLKNASITLKSTEDQPDDCTDATRHESLKKRPHRRSISPRDGDAPIRRAPDVSKKKRRRIDSDGNIATEELAGPHQTGSGAVAYMVLSRPGLDSSAPPQGAAPVAFMGNSNASPAISPTNANARCTDTRSPDISIDQATQRRNYLQDLHDQANSEESLLRQQRFDEASEQPTVKVSDEAQPPKVEKEYQQHELDLAEQQAREEVAREASERASRIARQQEEEARLEEQHKVEEAEKLARQEREIEEACLERQRKEEEMQRRQAEADRLLKEDQERKRVEKEEYERVARIRRQEEEEERRREALPNGLRRAAKLKNEEAKALNEILKWLPIFTVTGQQLDPDCNEEVKDERWTSNIQIAPILAVTDLDLSQCESVPAYSLDLLVFFLK